MTNNIIDRIKDCSLIFSSGNTVLLCGKYLWIYRIDGTLVIRHKEIRNPLKVMFLPNNTAIIDASGSRTYFYVSLDTGEIIWRSIKKGRFTGSAYSFCLSPDGTTVYDTSVAAYGVLRIDRLKPEEFFHDTYTVRDGLRVTDAMCCDGPNSLSILQSHMIVDPDNAHSAHSPPIRQNGVLTIEFSEDGATHYWKHYWQSNRKNRNRMRGYDGKYILFEDLTILDIETQHIFSLVGEERKLCPAAPFSWYYDSHRDFLFIYYIGIPVNIIIDCKERKVISRYVLEIDGQGCLIGNKYWIGTTCGVVQCPFPHMDPLPDKMICFGNHEKRAFGDQ